MSDTIGKTKPIFPEQLNPVYCVANLQGVGKREHQEDSFLFVNAIDDAAGKEKPLLALVADGMGGMKDGREASTTAIAVFREEFESFDFSGNIPLQIRNALFRASNTVNEKIGGDGGCTAVLGIIFGGKMHFASVGDSAVFLMRDFQLYRMNYEHNLLFDSYLEIIRGNSTVSQYEVKNDPNWSALTQFIGKSGMNCIDQSFRPLQLIPGDVILICSDGVSEYLTEAYILKSLSHGTPQDMCRNLEKGIYESNNAYQDNYTALVIQCRTEQNGEEKV